MALRPLNSLTAWCKPIEQAPNKGIAEQAKCRAIKFDDADGFVESLVANYSADCRVDYFEITGNDLIMIEMKDMELKIQHLSNNGVLKKDIEKKVLSNLENKFTDSLKIIQNEINSSLIPVINYLVVANNTNVIMLDKYLPKNPRKKPFVVCKTDEICNKLSTLGTRLCP
ncbi:hypothetical protein BTHERMOSOX_1266 [Bathymodiolus thermophilus thioautotrophic gill symbiont]|uniref:hypothetical protein n=1 Tax=Bathymodiolus thermophilus thioautotrophic gill symbiont TaxID=2360 RepID=UPI0010AF941E|nr:hypothetical protein [Bathymodiolus thermophilus thioautotrophic gill symbiont]SHA07454.1 hypothetical protein BTHERMOSOX_1266 [Bathymodiolus thermophilus thioautotrophic gill symbiont]